MAKTGVNDLRRSFLEFFESKGHLSMKSFSLVPGNDKSLLLINAGMAPLKPYFTGIEKPPRTRVTTCQKCIRTGDIENVGKTARHLTFFEMLGNFSFGDYFKREAIHWSYEYLTEVLGMDPDRLYPSVYGEDDEAFGIWEKEIGVDPSRITRFYRDPETGECDNFWEHGAGPCGPCSEIYYDRGEKYGCGKPTCKVGCDCDRYMEVWNNVFTQFEGDGKGNYTELKNKNIDTGMGLERLAVVMQDVDSVFDIDTMKAIRDKVCELSGKKYQTNEKDDISIRLITDHIRSSTFMISDGIQPSNEGRGYVLRRIIRRAARHGRPLGIEGNFLSGISGVVIDESKDGYPELEEKKDFILRVLTEEENKFSKTIDQGLNILDNLEKELKGKGGTVLSGEDAFKLYDTYGFPVDLTEEILEEKGYTLDRAGFDECMSRQKQQARSARKATNYMGADATVYESIGKDAPATEFSGYELLEDSSKIIFLAAEREYTSEAADILSEGDTGAVIVEKTPFYATMGGQVGDCGVITTPEGEFVVEETVKVTGDRYAHLGHVERGSIKAGEEAGLHVNKANRLATCRNHTATHLLQKALRDTLGSHVEQAGSFQDKSRIRFDFSHFTAMSADELAAVEKAVNEKIVEGIAVKTDVMSVDEAKKTGAMALFGEKYGEKVRVVSIGDYSKEFCGGTHVENTSDIGAFKIISESGIASGVRRIEALTAANVMDHYREMEEMLLSAAQEAKTTPKELVSKIAHMRDEIRQLNSEVESLKSKAAKDALGDVTGNAEKIGEVTFLPAKLSGVDMNGLRELGDSLKDKLPEASVIMLASENSGAVSLIVMASDAAVKLGAHAGNIIKASAPRVGGGGGGKPSFAQAGGKNPGGIDDAFETARGILAG